ncbi:MAG: response regulator [Candidatus Aminicenantes bacterium]|nr:response regulator [Candidatus Aminicenantes bacterium]
MNILIVDDLEENRYFLKYLFSGTGFRTEEAANGKAALDFLETGTWDLVISDILMPVMDGYQLCRRIRADERWRNLPFIFYTATYIDQRDEEFAMTLGADRFYRKPLDPRVLMNNVRGLLEEVARSRPRRPAAPADEAEVLRLYSERLVHKLEEKIARLEQETAQRKHAEEALRQSERQYRLITENTVDVITVLDMNLRITYVNSSIVRLRGYTPEEALAQTLDQVMTPESKALVSGILIEEMELEAKEGAEPTRSRNVELEEYRKNGTTVWTEVSLSFIRDEDLRPTGILTVSRDISERRRAEAKIQASLKEKEALLREIHHRVKNNMQIISSLVNLSARNINDPACVEALRQIRRRVRAIAAVHDSLYRSPDLAQIDIGNYLRDMVIHYAQAYAVDSARITITPELETIGLPIETAVPVGLIAGELIGNAMRHAFADGRRGRLNIGLRRLPDGQVLLAVHDDGIGVPPEFDLKKAESMGMVIVNSLTDQISGRFELIRDGGTEFRLTFRAQSA